MQVVLNRQVYSSIYHRFKPFFADCNEHLVTCCLFFMICMFMQLPVKDILRSHSVPILRLKKILTARPFARVCTRLDPEMRTILVQTTTTGLTNVPILSIEMLTRSPSASVNSGGGMVPVPVHTVVPFGTWLWRCSQSAK